VDHRERSGWSKSLVDQSLDDQFLSVAGFYCSYNTLTKVSQNNDRAELQVFQSFLVNPELRKCSRVNDAAVNKLVLNVTFAEKNSCYFMTMGFVMRAVSSAL